jgi:SAM-dependent methyltransferase
VTTKKDFYEDFWADNSSGPWTPRNRTIDPFEERLFERNIAPDARVLDFGCGDGAHSGVYLAQTGRKYVGVDVSDEALRQCGMAGLSTLRFNNDFTVPATDGEFDAVICFEVFEHIFEPVDAGNEILRLLRHDGVLIGSVPNVAFVGNRLLLALGIFSPGGNPLTSLKRPWADPHIRFFTPTTVGAFLTEVGFSKIEVLGTRFSLALLPKLYKLDGLLRRIIEFISLPFGWLGKVWPGLFTSRVYFVARK